MGALYPSAGAQSVEITLRTGLYADWRKAWQAWFTRAFDFSTRNRSPRAPSGRWLYITDPRYNGYLHLAPLQYQAAPASSWIPRPRIYPNRQGPGGFLVAGVPPSLNLHGYPE
jgi:hypothetical protein